MAKRKRLTPAQPGFLSSDPAKTESNKAEMAASPLASPPIAQVAGAASATAALSELGAELTRARAEGRMIDTLPLSVIDERHLVRDRIAMDDEDLSALKRSIEMRGQQSAIEVVELPNPKEGKTHGLISGWRRLTAMNRLYSRENDDKFARIKVRVLSPENAQAAYVAMVEENEIRAGLSLYERARIALRAMQEGVYEDTRSALQGLYMSISRSKRSKIGSFMPLVEGLDGALRFPAVIPEKLGLALSRMLSEDHAFQAYVWARLTEADSESAEVELKVLSRALESWSRRRKQASSEPAEKAKTPVLDSISGAKPAARPVPHRSGSVRVHFDQEAGRIELTGDVDADLYHALRDWLAQH